jgi:hypothetical protein
MSTLPRHHESHTVLLGLVNGELPVGPNYSPSPKLSTMAVARFPLTIFDIDLEIRFLVQRGRSRWFESLPALANQCRACPTRSTPIDTMRFQR